MDSKTLNNNWMKISIAIFCVAMISIPVGFTFPKVKSQSTDEKWPGIWTTKASMPTKLNGLGVGVVNNKIYVIGGRTFEGEQNIVEEYDPITDTWTTKQQMPSARSHLAIGVVNDKIYAIGGLGGMNVTEEYDPVTDTWSTNAPMPTSRFWFSVGVVNNKIYAIGGEVRGSEPGEDATVGIVEEYDPLTDSWTTKASMPTPRAGLAVGVVDGKIYAIGGKDIHHVNTTEMYDPETDTWSTKTPMPTGRGELAVGVVSGKIYAIGGSPGRTTNEEYHPIIDSWSTKASMLTPRESLGIGVVNDKIYAIGGQDSSKKVNANEEFNLDTSVDLDLDGLTNLQEFLNGTDPDNDDTDGDNLGDGFELTFSETDPTNWDTDEDSIGDGLEFVQNQGYSGSMQSLSNDWMGMTISWEKYIIYVKTNSSVFEGGFNKDEQKFEIKVSGPDGTQGTTEMDIPIGLCDPDDIKIKLDNAIIDFQITQNATYYHIRIEYTHSTHDLTAYFGHISEEEELGLFANYYLLALIISIVIILTLLILVIRNRGESEDVGVQELPAEQLSILLEKKHAEGKMRAETYDDIKSLLEKYQDR